MDSIKQYELQCLVSLVQTELVVISSQDHHIIGVVKESSPLGQSAVLRSRLIEGAILQDVPYIYKDDYQVCFVCIKSDEAYYLLGPFGTELLGRINLHHFYKKYEVEEKDEKQINRFAVGKMLEVIALAAAIITGCQYGTQLLLSSNKLVTDTKTQDDNEKIFFDLNKDDEELYHHTYQEERKLLACVREGRAEDALERNKQMDVVLGKLSMHELNHWKNVEIGRAHV